MPAPSLRLFGIEDQEGLIEMALSAYEPVRSSHVPLKLDVDPSGLVRLKGWVRSRVIRDSIADIVRRVPGVVALDLSLVVDPELEVQVARALATSPGTAGLAPGNVILRASLGTVRLIGRVPTAAMKDSVAQVAKQVAGVRGIENELEVVGKK